MQVGELLMDNDLKSLLPYGEPSFPYVRYDDEIARYKNACISWHWHDELEFNYVTNNSVTCEFEQGPITLCAGEGLFINSGVIHSFKTTDEGVMCSFLFSPQFIAPVFTTIYQKFVAPVLNSNLRYIVLQQQTPWQGSILDLLSQNTNLSNSANKATELDIHLFIGTVWKILVESLSQNLLGTQDYKTALLQERMHNMLTFISQNYADNIMVEDIAKAASISKSEAQRCFHKAVHTTPNNYLIEYRLGEAYRLLQTTSKPISKIAIDTGFESVSYFDRKYKQRFGISPRQTRGEATA